MLLDSRRGVCCAGKLLKVDVDIGIGLCANLRIRGHPNPFRGEDFFILSGSAMFPDREISMDVICITLGLVYIPLPCSPNVQTNAPDTSNRDPVPDR